jgi:hypothetical protein
MLDDLIELLSSAVDTAEKKEQIEKFQYIQKSIQSHLTAEYQDKTNMETSIDTLLQTL